MNIVIDKVNSGQFAEILFDLNLSIFIESYHTAIRDLETFIKDYKDTTSLIAYDAQKPVGFILFSNREHHIELEEFGILPEYQHHGVGKLLMQRFLEETKGHEIHLITNPDNSGAIIFYLKNGFKIVDWKENFYGDGKPWLLLRRPTL